MSKGLQWVVGIGVVLIVATLVAASLAPYVLARLGVAAAAPQFGGPFHMFGPRMPLRPGMMFGLGGRAPFFGFFGLAGCIWPLLLAGLIVVAISALSRRPAPYIMQPTTGHAPMPVAPMAPTAPTSTPASQAVCANCGQPLQAGWRHCPNCGAPVAQ